MLLVLSGCQLNMLVEIQLAQLDKDGMVMVVLKFLAPLVPSTMEHNAFALVLKNTNVNLGSISMELNVFTSHSNALLEHNGTKLLAYP